LPPIASTSTLKRSQASWTFGSAKAVPAQSRLVGLSINKLELRGNGSFIIVAVRRRDGTTVTHPHDSLVLQPGDTVIVMSPRGDVPPLTRRSAQRRQMRDRR